MSHSISALRHVHDSSGDVPDQAMDRARSPAPERAAPPDLARAEQLGPRISSTSAAPIQRIIHTGKTHRSRPYKKIGGTSWFRGLDSDEHRDWARHLHKSKTSYTKSEALEEIEQRLKAGNKAPSSESAKSLRAKRVREYVNDSAPSLTSTPYLYGLELSKSSRRTFNQLHGKYGRTRRYVKAVRKINKQKPGLFEAQKPILSKLSPFQQFGALVDSKPESYNFNFGGHKVTLDSLSVKSNEKRSESRPRSKPWLPQVFVPQRSGHNSYWDISDSNDSDVVRERPHKRLRTLESFREPMSAFTTLAKDNFVENDIMSPKVAYGDQVPFAFQEFKGALSPTENMRRLQMGSSYQVLRHGLKKKPNLKFGTKIRQRPRTTPQLLNRSLGAYMTKKTKKNRRKLDREMFRFHRAMTEEDVSSDEESESDSSTD
jgi:hypothetical protein